MAFEFLILVFTSIFVILDPFANIPFFSAILDNYSTADKKKIIFKSSIIAFVLFMFFSFFGTLIFSVLGIQFYSFKIAGGILLGAIAFELLFGKTSATKTKNTKERIVELKHMEDNLTVTPLAIPMLTGPGAITTGLVLFGQANSVPLIGEFIIASLFAFIFVYLILTNSGIVEKLIGKTGMKVITRIMGLLLLSIAVQFIASGAIEFIQLI